MRRPNQETTPIPRGVCRRWRRIVLASCCNPAKVHTRANQRWQRVRWPRLSLDGYDSPTSDSTAVGHIPQQIPKRGTTAGSPGPGEGGQRCVMPAVMLAPGVILDSHAEDERKNGGDGGNGEWRPPCGSAERACCLVACASRNSPAAILIVVSSAGWLPPSPDVSSRRRTTMFRLPSLACHSIGLVLVGHRHFSIFHRENEHDARASGF